MKLTSRLFVVAVVLMIFSQAPRAVLAQGIMLRSVGPVNASVGGTATAMPLDASGALYWNPASISALKQNEMTFGMQLILPSARVESDHQRFGNGSTKGESGVKPVPSMAFVWRKCPRSPFTFGLGKSAVGGASSLYRHDMSNPVLMPHGRSSSVMVMQVTPTVAVQLTERMSVGVAPIIDLASLNINPMSLGNDVSDPLVTYGTRYVWGAGFQIGALYDFQNNWKAGFMFKSPIWAEKLHFSGSHLASNSPTGFRDGTTNFQLNLPMTLSAGVSYDGLRNTIIGMDVRYLDYSNTAGFKRGIVSKEGKSYVEGLDWDSVFSINLGLERKINNKLKARMGYCWNENPIPSRSAHLCVSSPMVTQHVFSCGFTHTFARNLEMSVAYAHAFKAKLSGDLLEPNNSGTLVKAGTVTSTLSSDALFMGLTKKW